MENYKRVTMMTVLYKIYVMVLMEKLRDKSKRKGIILQNQTRFRKGMDTIDNIL